MLSPLNGYLTYFDDLLQSYDYIFKFLRDTCNGRYHAL